MQKYNKLIYCFLKRTANELRYLKETDAKFYISKIYKYLKSQKQSSRGAL